MAMITDRLIRATITTIVSGGKAGAVLRDPSERGGGRLRLELRPAKGRVSAEWYVGYQRQGQRRSIKLGDYPSLTLPEARRRFREDFQPVLLEGRDPPGPRAWRKPTAPTMLQLAQAYVMDLEEKGKPASHRFYYVLLAPGGAVEAIGPNKPVATVTPDDIWPHIKGIYARGKAPYARYVRDTLRSCFQYALKSRYSATATHSGMDWGIRSNPVDLIDHIPRNQPRRRVLSPAEFRAFWFWSEDIQRRPRYRNAAAIMLMLLTGQRPSEILKLTAEQYDPVEGALSWDTTKNGRGHDIPLCRQAVALMDRLQPNAHGLYFPRQRLIHEALIPDAAAAYVAKYVRETGAEPFQLRDLRRTWKTLATEAGIPKAVCDHLQNHALADVSGRHYVQSQQWGLKMPAVEFWSEVVDYILHSAEPVTRRSLAGVGRVRLEAVRLLPPAEAGDEGS